MQWIASECKDCKISIYIYVYICMHVLDDVALDNVREKITLILNIPDW